MVISYVPDEVKTDRVLSSPFNLANVVRAACQRRSQRRDILEFLHILSVENIGNHFAVAQEESLLNTEEDQVNIVRNLKF